MEGSSANNLASPLELLQLALVPTTSNHPILHYKMPVVYTLAHREHVPFCPFNPPTFPSFLPDVSMHPLMPPILFSPIGVRLVDILRQGAKMVPGAQDLVFNQAPYKVMKLLIMWPAYAGSGAVSINLYTDGTPITRVSLATVVAKLFFEYLEPERCKSLPKLPDYSKWRIGEGGLYAHNVIFNRLVNTYGNVWQVDCDIAV